MVVAAFCSPLVLIALVSRLFLPSGLLESVAVPGIMLAETPGITAGLMSDMVNLAIGMTIAAWALFRQAVVAKAQARHLIFAIAVSASAFISLFAGLRGQYALAFIISTQSFALQKLAPFIEVQAVFLALTMMLLVATFAHYLIHRDRRSRIAER